jgi:hypothetical protein
MFHVKLGVLCRRFSNLSRLEILMARKTRKDRLRLKRSRVNSTSRLVHLYRRINKLSKKNFLTIFGLVATISVSYFIYRLSYDLPDIRMMEAIEEEQLDARQDDQGNAVFLISSKYVFKNFSLKSGYVDKVEAAPKTLDGLPIVEVVNVDKTLIGWREEKEIEIRMKLISPMSAMSKLAGLGPKEVKEARVEIRFYDDTGKLIAISPTGEVGPLLIGLGYSYNKEELLKRMDP